MDERLYMERNFLSFIELLRIKFINIIYTDFKYLKNKLITLIFFGKLASYLFWEEKL